MLVWNLKIFIILFKFFFISTGLSLKYTTVIATLLQVIIFQLTKSKPCDSNNVLCFGSFFCPVNFFFTHEIISFNCELTQILAHAWHLHAVAARVLYHANVYDNTRHIFSMIPMFVYNSPKISELFVQFFFSELKAILRERNWDHYFTSVTKRVKLARAIESHLYFISCKELTIFYQAILLVICIYKLTISNATNVA